MPIRNSGQDPQGCQKFLSRFSAEYILRLVYEHSWGACPSRMYTRILTGYSSAGRVHLLLRQRVPRKTGRESPQGDNARGSRHTSVKIVILVAVADIPHMTVYIISLWGGFPSSIAR